ncbi:MAG: hypothetical protein AAF683_03800 [Pseudomonadota bacterium]
MGNVRRRVVLLVFLGLVGLAWFMVERSVERPVAPTDTVADDSRPSNGVTSSLEGPLDPPAGLDSINDSESQFAGASQVAEQNGQSVRDPRELSLDELPPEALARMEELGYVPAEIMSRDSYQSYDLETLKALARNGDGKAATMVATDWTVDREERYELAIIAARAGAPAALHLMATGEFQAPEYLPDGLRSLDESYVWYLAATQLLDGRVTQSNVQIERYASLLTDDEISTARRKAKQLVAEIRRP